MQPARARSISSPPCKQVLLVSAKPIRSSGLSPGFDSHFRRYDKVYQAFLVAGIPLIGLAPGTKKPSNISASKSHLRNLYQVEAAMDAGLNIGAVTHLLALSGINKMGFWDLDIDGPDHGLDLSPFTYRVRRRGEPIRAHYLARLPDPCLPLETSLNGRDYDLCTWNTVMPGSVHEDQTVYELEHLEDGEWVLWDGEPFAIEMLPLIDPERYRAQDNRRKGKHPASIPPLKMMPSASKARKPPQAPKKAPIWIPATGSLATRTKMAKNYLRYYAWKSVSGKNGHDALMVVVTNLRLYHLLDQCLALMMVKQHFNPRCIDLQGNPSPWSDAEILHKWNQAGKRGVYPTLGVENPKARRKTATLILEGEVAEFLGQFTQAGGATNPTLLRQAFVAVRGGVDVNATAFGRAMSKVTGTRTTSPNGIRCYQGFRLIEAGLGFTRRVTEAA